MKKPRFYIYDDSANTGKPYINENGENTGIYEDRQLFTTEKKAQKFAKSLNPNKKWYSILKN
ncbi:MAG TPA: hypothetical protein PLT78_14980 [Ignavibacteriaceae bacterium]|nr:hypothetical protein [Ignavibacteriaceae bacterium]